MHHSETDMDSRSTRSDLRSSQYLGELEVTGGFISGTIFRDALVLISEGIVQTSDAKSAIDTSASTA